MIDGNGLVVTAKKLLEHYEASLVEEVMLVKEPLDLGHVPKIEEVGFGYGPKVGRLEAPKEALERVDSLWIEQPTWPKETSLLKSEALPKQIPLVEISLPNAEKQPKSEPAHRRSISTEENTSQEGASAQADADAFSTTPPIHNLPETHFPHKRQNQVQALEPRTPVQYYITSPTMTLTLLSLIPHPTPRSTHRSCPQPHSVKTFLRRTPIPAPTPAAPPTPHLSTSQPF